MLISYVFVPAWRLTAVRGKKSKIVESNGHAGRDVNVNPNHDDMETDLDPAAAA